MRNILISNGREFGKMFGDEYIDAEVWHRKWKMECIHAKNERSS